MLAVLLTIASCTPDQPKDPNTPTPDQNEFPKTVLLEQFTSESCLNCPDGDVQVDEYIGQHPQTVLLAHHAGYKQDPLTIKTSSSLAQYLGISGTPTVTVDRADYGFFGQNVTFHPYYLAQGGSVPATTYASIELTSTCEGGHATIHAEGQVAKGHKEQLRLSVVIKENGIHGTQLDPAHTLAGSWADYVHAAAIRTFVSNPLGDSIEVSEGRYSADYTVELEGGWVAENCMVVAFLSDANGLNIVQAAETPAVAGTTGGKDIAHGGVTPKPVPDGYPEGKYSLADFVGSETVTLETARVMCSALDNGLKEWHINGWTTSQSYGTGNNKFIPLCDIIFFTEGGATAVPTSGEMIFKVAKTVDQITAGTGWAGVCDIEGQRIFGSEVDMVNYDAFLVGDISIGSNGRWLIGENSVIRFTETGFSLEGTSATGKTIKLVYNGAL